MTKNKSWTLLLVFASFLWGASFAVMDIALLKGTEFEGEINEFFLLGFRFTLGSLILILFFVKEFKRIKNQDVKSSLTLGTMLFIPYVLQTIGLSYTTTSNNAFITSFFIILVPMLSVLILKTKLEVKMIFAIVLAFIGITILSLDFSNFSIGFGDLLTLGSAFGYSFHILFVTIFNRKDINRIIVGTGQLMTVGLLGIIFGFISSLTTDHFNPITTGFIDHYTNIKMISIILSLALLPTAICFTIQIFAQRYVGESKAGLILGLEGVFGAIIAIIVLASDKLTWEIAVGGFLMLIAIIITELDFTKIKEKFYKK